MITSWKFDLFEEEFVLPEPIVLPERTSPFTIDFDPIEPDAFDIDAIVFETVALDPDTFVFAPAPAPISGFASASGFGTASASFTGFASGSGSSSISVSASSYVAPDGSSGSSVSASASGDVVGGSGTARAGDDVDSFTFDMADIDLASIDRTPATPIEIDFDVEPFDLGGLDLSLWF